MYCSRSARPAGTDGNVAVHGLDASRELDQLGYFAPMRLVETS